MPNNDVPLPFPVKGINVTREFSQQPELTTVDCDNVFSRDTISERYRGGSRPGLSKLVNDRGFHGAVSVQMLDMIVDPQAAALTQNFETPGSDWIPHPRFPTILIPPRGAPWQPTEAAAQPTNDIAFVQGKRTQQDLEAATLSTSFASNVTGGNTIVVFVATEVSALGVGGSGATVTVTNGVGTAYTQAGSYVEILHPSTLDTYLRLSCWYKKISNTVDDRTVKVTPVVSANIVVSQLEYSNIKGISPLDATNTNSDTSLPPPSTTTGNVAVNGSNEVVLGAFFQAFDLGSSFTPAAGFTLRPSEDTGAGADSLRLNIAEKVPVSNPANNPTAVTGTTGGGEDPYVAIAVTFKPQ